MISLLKANCGYIVNYGNVSDLKEKLKRLIENPTEAEQMVERGKKYICENLGWDKVAERIEKIYHEIGIYHYEERARRNRKKAEESDG